MILIGHGKVMAVDSSYGSTQAIQASLARLSLMKDMIPGIIAKILNAAFYKRDDYVLVMDGDPNGNEIRSSVESWGTRSIKRQMDAWDKELGTSPLLQATPTPDSFIEVWFNTTLDNYYNRRKQGESVFSSINNVIADDFWDAAERIWDAPGDSNRAYFEEESRGLQPTAGGR